MSSAIKRKHHYTVGTFIKEVIFIAITAIMMIPIYYLLITTLKTPEQATLHPLRLPTKFLFQGYIDAWNNMNYPNAFKNTFLITVLSLAGMLLFSAMAAYPIARKRNRFNNTVFFILLAGMMIPFQMSIMAQYRIVQSIGLMNNILSVVLINIAVNLPMAILFMRNFIIASVPPEIEEAAFIDGCGVARTFLSITIPLLRPVLATLAIMNCMNIWNDFLTPLMFLQTSSSRTILLEVNSNIGRFATDWTSLFPMMVLGILPLVIFFLIMQKNIIAGLSMGGVKG